MKTASKKLRSLFFHNRSKYYENIENIKQNVSISLGKRRLFFSQTFQDKEHLVDELLRRRNDEFNFAFYVQDPQVLMDLSSEKLTLDKAVSLRLEINKYIKLKETQPQEVEIRFLRRQDIPEINKIYNNYGMFPIDYENTRSNNESKKVTYFVAEKDNEIVGIVIGVDHKELFNSPEDGCSLFGLAVMPGDRGKSIGKWLINYVAGHYEVKGRSYVDLYVSYNNERAIGLYESLGFQKVPRFSVYPTVIKEELAQL